MLNIDYSLFIQMASFIILVILLNIILYRPIRRILIMRKNEISSMEEVTWDLKHKADDYLKEYEDNLSDANKKGFKEKNDLKNRGMEEERETLRQTYSSVEERTRNARMDIQDRISHARQSLQKELESFSQDLAEKILGRNL
jgi:F-type H+-transporting ATPase subunit b